MDDFNPSSPLVQWGVVIGASLAAAVTDLLSRKIPNALTLPLAVGGLAWSLGVGGVGGVDGLLGSIGACLLLALPYVILYAFAGGGAGDAKMMGAIGTWVGFKAWGALLVLGSVALFGIVLAVAYAVAHRKLRSVTMNIKGVVIACTAARSREGFQAALREVPAVEEMTTIPYGVAIFVGTCVAAGVVWAGGGL